MSKTAKSTSTFDFSNIIPVPDEPITTKNDTAVKSKKNSVTEGGIKRNYYLPPDIIKAINIMSAEKEISKNELVQHALREYLKDYLS